MVVSDEKKSAYQAEVNRHVEAAKLAAESITIMLRIPHDLPGVESLYVTPSYVSVETEPDAFVTVVAAMLKAFSHKTARKSFNQYTGAVEANFYTGKTSVRIVSTPTRCEVESYEEMVYEPARTQVVKKFRLKNPAECLGADAQALES